MLRRLEKGGPGAELAGFDFGGRVGAAWDHKILGDLRKGLPFFLAVVVHYKIQNDSRNSFDFFFRGGGDKPRNSAAKPPDDFFPFLHPPPTACSCSRQLHPKLSVFIKFNLVI